MRGNTFGKLFSLTSFGESHGPALGVVVDGVPGGLDISMEDLQAALDKRAPGQVPGVTSRKEPDQAKILSGVFEGKTLGTPIAVMVENTNQRSQDYDKIKNEYRPGHADETTIKKYGIRDHRGGGRASARVTLARVIAGYFADLILPKNISVRAAITKMGPFISSPSLIDSIPKDLGIYNYWDSSKTQEIQDYLKGLKGKGESCGGKIYLRIEGTPAGLGEPVYDKLKADMAKGMLSINACTSFSYGLGEGFAHVQGTEVSDKAEVFGGIEGGISSGEPITMTMTFKPTSTIGEKAKHGRHDPCVLPRAVPVVEAMAKIVLADHYLRQKAYQIEKQI